MQYKGWDLEAQGIDDTLLIEVKGLAGASAVIELTPNEYTQMQALRPRWMLFIVTNCLSPSQLATEVRFDSVKGCWLTRAGQVILVTPKVGAVVSANPSSNDACS